MEQTPLKPEYLRRLADLNDQVCYFLFLESQFRNTLEGLPDGAGEEIGSEVFPDNPWSELIDFPVNHYYQLQNENKEHTFGSYFSACYEVLRDYQQSVSDFLASVNEVEFEASGDAPVEERLFDSLEDHGYEVPDREIEYTLSYCRLRRNHWSHLRRTVSQGMRNVIRRHGEELDGYWDQKDEIEFGSEDVSTFQAWETIELIAVLRASLLRIDSVIASSLQHRTLLRKLAECIWQENPHRRGVEHVEKRAGILQGRVHWEYATEIDMREAVEISEQVGRELG